MTLKIDATVHSVGRTMVGVNTQVEGADTRVLVEGLNVELTTVQNRHGSFMLNFFGADAHEAAELFKPDAKVEIGFKAAG